MGADTYFWLLYLIGFKHRLRLGHSRTFTELSISHSCCVRVIVLLAGEPSAQSEILNALDWVFIKAIYIFWCIELFFYSDVSLSPCRWKTTSQHEDATSTLYFWDGTLQVMSRAGFLQTWCLELRFTRPENLISHSLIFIYFFANSKCVSRVFTEERTESGHTSIKHKLVECCSDVCPSVGFSYLHIWSWSSTSVTISFLVMVSTLTKALLHQLLSLARRPALGRVLVVPNVSHCG